MFNSSRRFVSLQRTVHTANIHTLDAIDDEGRAWWLILDPSGDCGAPLEWTELIPLPTREELP